MPTHQPWHRLSSRYLLKRWWMNIREDHVRLPNGVELEEFHVLEYPDWACVVALTEAGEVVTVEQYRYGIDEVTIELPGGALEPGEDPAVGALRELREESGYEADELRLLGVIAPDPTRHTNFAHLYFAPNARLAGAQQLDDSEDLHVRLIPAPELLRLADTGQLRHGIHLTAVLWAQVRGWM